MYNFRGPAIEEKIAGDFIIPHGFHFITRLSTVGVALGPVM
jgi:hypothetical protein